MCNECTCKEEKYDHCSILGHMPVGFCCELCVNHATRHDCGNYQFTLVKTINPSFKKAGVEKGTENEKEEEVTLIINKHNKQ